MRRIPPEYGLSVDGGPKLQNVQFRNASMLVVYVLVPARIAQHMFLDSS